MELLIVETCDSIADCVGSWVIVRHNDNEFLVAVDKPLEEISSLKPDRVYL